MMTPQAFIENQLSLLAEKFPHICIRYAFDHTIDTYIVHLDPVEEYYENQKLDAAWVPVALDFNEKFEECITFISSDSPLRLAKWDMEWNSVVMEEASCLEEQGVMA